MIAEANEYMLSSRGKKHDEDDGPKPPAGGGTSTDDRASEKPENKGTLILDVTCTPVNIRYPQYVSLLNEAREKLETILYRFHKSYGHELPRHYAKRACKNYPAFAKCKKRKTKKIHKTLRQQLAYVKRDIGYLNKFMADGYAPEYKEISLLLTIFKLYEQQKYMYDNKVHSVENRIVSISQPCSEKCKNKWTYD